MKDFSHLELIDYLKIPWKRRWYVLAASVLVLAATAAYAWLNPDRYRSETKILVESGTLLDDTLSPSAARDRMEERANSIRQLIQSRSILTMIVEEFRMRAADSSIPMEEALRSIQRNLEISKAAGGAFTMSYTASNPQVAQAVARRLAEILIQTNQAAQKNKAEEKDQFIEQELRQAELDLAAIDEKIKLFKAGHLGELPEQSTANMNALNGLHNQLAAVDNALDRARDQQKSLVFRIQEQRRLGALARTIAPKDAPGRSPAAQSTSPALSTLLLNRRAQLAEATSRFTQKHPDVIRLTKEVEDLEQRLSKEQSGDGQIPQTALGPQEDKKPEMDPGITQVEINTEAEIAQAKYDLDLINQTISRREKERADLLKRISLYQNRLNLAPALEQELVALMREHNTKQQHVASLQTRKFNAQIAANAAADKNNDIYRVLDEASLPERPIFPTRMNIIVIGIAISLSAGLAAAVAREFFDTSLANEEEAMALFNLPILASIPEIPES